MTEPTTPGTALELRQDAQLARPNVDHDVTDSWVAVIEQVSRLAVVVSSTEFVPRGLRDKPAAVTAAILHGREVGLPPMTALAGTHMIEGKPTLSAETLRALVLAAGHTIETTESTGSRCVMRARRRGTETFTSLTWSIEQARAIGLAGKDVWKKYPRAMLQARCSAELIRLVFPDVAHGMGAAEEALDDVDVDGVVDEPAAPAATVSRSGSRGRTRTRSAGVTDSAPPADRPGDAETPGDVPAADPIAPPLPEPETAAQPPEQDSYTAPPAPDPAATVLPMETLMVTTSQLRLLGATWSELKVTDDQDRRDFSALLTGNQAASETTKKLTKRDATKLIDLLAGLKGDADRLHALVAERMAAQNGGDQ